MALHVQSEQQVVYVYIYEAHFMHNTCTSMKYNHACSVCLNKIACITPLCNYSNPQVLTFVRTGLGISVDNREVVALHMHKELKLTHTAGDIRNAVTKLEWGKASDTKDFLDRDKTEGTAITRQTSARKRALNVYLDKLPEITERYNTMYILCIIMGNSA